MMKPLLIAALAVSACAATIHIDVAKEKAGSEPASFIPVVGNWVVVDSGGKNVLMVDGRQWKKGQPAGGLADKARLVAMAEAWVKIAERADRVAKRLLPGIADPALVAKVLD